MPSRRNTMTIRKGDKAVTVDAYFVAHNTDAAGPFTRPVLLNQSMWFDEVTARAYAQETSTLHPALQRFTVYDPDGVFVCTYQCGQEVSPFTMVS